MNIDNARQLLDTQVSVGGYPNRNSMWMILTEVQREHRILEADTLIVEFNLEEKLAFDRP